MTTSSRPLLVPGKRFAGKWKRNEYIVERELGEGANGRVYLVSRNKSQFAMKVGADAVDLQSEVNVLQTLSRSPGAFRGFLIDADDVEEAGGTYPFYVMKYVKGMQLQNYIRQKGTGWFSVIGLRLLEKLGELHEKGWVFGDLKKENVLVSHFGEVELVDFGGVTPKGKAVKQFTEVYDRGHWDAGTRTADEGYDLFAFAILCIQVCGGRKESFSRHVLPQNRGTAELLSEIARDGALREFEPFLKKVLLGMISSSKEAYIEWKKLMHNRGTADALKGQKPGGWLKAGFVASLILFLSVLLYYK